jgi:hypothetical protein
MPVEPGRDRPASSPASTGWRRPGWPRSTWEPPAAARGARRDLLPGLFLARVDGKSPVEYLTADADRARVRRVARALLLAHPVGRLAAVRDAWKAELAHA